MDLQKVQSLMITKYECVISSIKAKRSSNWVTVIGAIYQGLFTDVQFDQILVEEFRGEFLNNSLTGQSFSKTIEDKILTFDKSPHIRIAVGKQLNSLMNPQYKASIDLDLKEVNSPGRVNFVRQIIKYMIGIELNTLDRSFENESEIRSLLSISDRCSNVSLPIQEGIHR